MVELLANTTALTTSARFHRPLVSAAAHEKRTETDLVLDGSHGCAGFCRFRCCCHAVVEIGFELTG